MNLSYAQGVLLLCLIALVVYLLRTRRRSGPPAAPSRQATDVWKPIHRNAATLLESWGATADQVQRVYSDLRESAIARLEADRYGVEDMRRSEDFWDAERRYSTPMRHWIISENLHIGTNGPRSEGEVNKMALNLPRAGRAPSKGVYQGEHQKAT